jgi:hypothetical protein
VDSDRRAGSERDLVFEHGPCALDPVLLSGASPQRRGGLRLLQQGERHHVRRDSDGDSDSHTDADADGNRDSHADSDADASSDGNTDAHADSHADASSDGNTDAHADSHADSHADASSDGNPHAHADADSDVSRSDANPDADFLQRRRALGEVVSGWWFVR